MEYEKASQRPFDGDPYTRLAGAYQAAQSYGPKMCSFQGAPPRLIYELMLRAPEKRLSIRRESVHAHAVSKHAALHSIEIIFYSPALLVAGVGSTWFFLG